MGIAERNYSLPTKPCPMCEGMRKIHDTGAICFTKGECGEPMDCLVCDGTGRVPLNFGDFEES